MSSQTGRSTPEFVIRPLDWSRDNIDSLTDLLHRPYAGLLAQGLRFTATSQTSETTRHRMWGSSPFLMEVHGVVVGTLTLSYPISHEDNDPEYYAQPGVALLSQFGLEREFQGVGLGAAFCRFAVDWCVTQGATELALDTSDQATHLIEMYDHWGFRAVDQHQWGSVNYRSVVMARGE